MSFVCRNKWLVWRRSCFFWNNNKGCGERMKKTGSVDSLIDAQQVNRNNINISICDSSTIRANDAITKRDTYIAPKGHLPISSTSSVHLFDAQWTPSSPTVPYRLSKTLPGINQLLLNSSNNDKQKDCLHCKWIINEIISHIIIFALLLNLLITFDWIVRYKYNTIHYNRWIELSFRCIRTQFVSLYNRIIAHNCINVMQWFDIRLIIDVILHNTTHLWCIRIALHEYNTLL